MTPPRILLVEQNEDCTVGGSHQALYDLAVGLRADGREPVVAFYQDNVFVEQLRSAGVETHVLEDVRVHERAIRRIPIRAIRLVDVPAAVLRRLRLLRRLRIGLVHLINTPAIGFDDWLPAARLAGIPILTSAMAVLAPINTGTLQRRLQRSFDRVLPVSRYMADEWADRGLPPDRMVTVHHGVNADALEAGIERDRADVRATFDVGDDQILVVMAANIRPWKGQHVVVDALARMVPDERARVRLVFAGAVADSEQAYAEQLHAAARDAGLEGCVRFLGRRADVPDLINAADVVLHASVLPEPGGIIVLEAMALGAAVIASDRGGHIEILVPGTGLVFNPDEPQSLTDALRTLMSDPAHRRDLGRAARQRARAFNVDRYVLATAAVYDELLGVRPRFAAAQPALETSTGAARNAEAR